MIGNVATNRPPTVKPHCQRLLSAALTAALAATALSSPGPAAGFDKRLAIGAGGGYSQLFRRQATDPTSTYGGGAAAHITFGLTDTFGISLGGGMAWFGGYTPAVPMDTVDEDGEPVTVYVKGPETTDLTAWDLALSLIYAIDVTLVVPYLEIGAVAARVAERQDGAEVVDLEVGMRTNMGFDYLLFDHLSLGAAAGIDTYFTGNSGYSSRLNFLVRLTVVWDLGELGSNDDSE